MTMMESKEDNENIKMIDLDLKNYFFSTKIRQ